MWVVCVRVFSWDGSVHQGRYRSETLSGGGVASRMAMGWAEKGTGLVDLMCLGLQWRRGKSGAGSVIGRSPVIGESLDWRCWEAGLWIAG